MCWTTCDKRNAAVKTAERDIPVFKVVNAAGSDEFPAAGADIRRAYPYYRYDRRWRESSPPEGAFTSESGKRTFVYEPGAEYTASGFAPDSGAHVRVEGFHSYSPERALKKDGFLYKVARPRRAAGDADARDIYPRRDFAWRVGWIVPCVMDCVIPEGSRYCVNENGEYVSDRIRVEGFAPMESRAEK